VVWVFFVVRPRDFAFPEGVFSSVRKGQTDFPPANGRQFL